MAMDEESKLRRDIARGAGIGTVQRLLELLEEKDWEPFHWELLSRRHVAKAVANAFISGVLDVLNDEEVALMVERNRSETLESVCHSHDFVDANMYMDVAFRQVMGVGLFDGKVNGEIDERKIALWNEAWDLAREAEFDAKRVGQQRRSTARRRKNPRDGRDRLERAAARGDAAAKARLEAEREARVSAELERHGISEGDVDDVLSGYLEAILFTENDNEDPEGGESLDRNYCVDDFDTEFVEKARRMCRMFVAENADDLVATADMVPRGEWSPWEHHGHDIWMTSRGLGVGFWDRGYGEAGRRLSDACKRRPYSASEHYATFVEDGKVYVE